MPTIDRRLKPLSFARLLELVLEALRLQRDNGEWTERELARRARISQPLMNNVLSGKRRLTPHVADKLLAAAGLDLGSILGGLETPVNRPGDRLLVEGPRDFGLVELRR